MTTPIQLAAVPGSLELDREIYRQAVDLIKASKPVHIVSFNEPDHPPAFMHYVENEDQPFAVAIYYKQQKARYFILLRKISHTLRVMITKLEKEHAKQDKLRRFVPPAGKAKPKTGKGSYSWIANKRGLTLRPRDTSTPFRPNRRSKA